MAGSTGLPSRARFNRRTELDECAATTNSTSGSGIKQLGTSHVAEPTIGPCHAKSGANLQKTTDTLTLTQISQSRAGIG